MPINLGITFDIDGFVTPAAEIAFKRRYEANAASAWYEDGEEWPSYEEAWPIGYEPQLNKDDNDGWAINDGPSQPDPQ